MYVSGLVCVHEDRATNGIKVDTLEMCGPNLINQATVLCLWNIISLTHNVSPFKLNYSCLYRPNTFLNCRIFNGIGVVHSGPKAGMALVGHADANRHALLNTRTLAVYSTCRLCSKHKLSASSWWSRGNAQWVVQQMRVGSRAGFQHLEPGSFG
jgi:hypothetical protein